MTVRRQKPGLARAACAAALVLATAGEGAAQRPVPPEERAKAIASIHPVCRQYYRMLERCARANPDSGLARELDGELMALVMLSHGERAGEACGQQIGNNRTTALLGCDWTTGPAGKPASCSHPQPGDAAAR